MEIKVNLDTEKAAKATVAIAASYGLGQVPDGTKTLNLPSPRQLPSLPSLQSFTAPAWHLKQRKPT